MLKERRVTPIRNGTVIDHLPASSFMYVLRILGYDDSPMGNTTSVLINVPSRKAGFKDLIKIEDRELATNEYQKIALAAWSFRPKIMPTLNTIRNYAVVEKATIELADHYERLVRCSNGGEKGGCISNTERWMNGLTRLVGRNGKFFCYYCDREQTPEEMRKAIITGPVGGRQTAP